jgi:hypothetical protein
VNPASAKPTVQAAVSPRGLEAHATKYTVALHGGVGILPGGRSKLRRPHD